MPIAQSFYRVLARVRHNLTAFHTGGEGIHSPYLFYLVRYLMYDRNVYYAWIDIEQMRSAMLGVPKLLHIKDFGTGCDRSCLVQHIAKNCLADRKTDELLFRLIIYLYGEDRIHDQALQHLNIVELGTSLGLTTAYLAAADSRNKVTTFEGADEVLDIAKRNWNKLNLTNITPILGNIDATLPQWIELINKDSACVRVDLVFHDANHTAAATLKYYENLRPLLHHKSIYVLDDIHYSREMEQAWEMLKARPEVTSSMDLYRVGILFFDPCYLPKNYKLRI